MTPKRTQRLTVRRAGQGRVLYVQPDGTIYMSRRYRIYRSTDDGKNWTEGTAMPCPLGRRLAQPSRLACRLLRHEVRALVVLSDGTCVASNRDGIFHAPPGHRLMSRSRTPDHEIAPRPPMTIALGPGDRVLWGEYCSNPERRQVRLYVSQDAGRSFEVGHVFPTGEIRHVHNIVYDETLDQYWVLTGDFGGEAGIGLLSADQADFEWVARGTQEYRAVCVFSFSDSLVYGTDTEKEANAVMRLDKATGRVQRIVELEGSCIYACRFGGLYALSTTVEPSTVNLSKDAALWFSRDGERWAKVFTAPKDRWHPKYFQYGSLVLPHGASNREVITFSGQALRGLDGQTMVGSLADGAL